MAKMEFLEKTLEQLVFENIDKMPARGLDIFYKNTRRQVTLGGCRFDILTWEVVDRTINARVVEFKRENITLDALLQALNYRDEIMAATIGLFKDFNLEVVMVGSKKCTIINRILNLSDYIHVYEYEYGFDGVKFTNIGFGDTKIKNFFRHYKDPNDDENYIDFCNLLKMGA